MTGPDAINAVKIVLFGAAAPNTALNAQPYTMPPFARTLSSADVAAVVNVMRKRWGNPERAVSAEDVLFRRSKLGLRFSPEQRRALDDYMAAKAAPPASARMEARG